MPFGRGQFISPDTLVPDATNLFAYNRYMYVHGNPMRYNDPTGHIGISIEGQCECGGGVQLEQVTPQQAVEVGLNTELTGRQEVSLINAHEAPAPAAESAPLEKAVNANEGVAAPDASPAPEVGESGTAGENTVSDASSNSSIEITYRGDGRSPDEVFKTGFQPKGANTDLQKYTSYNTPSVYVSTSKSVDIATQFAGKGNYVYIVHPQNGIDVNKVLGASSPFPDELEIAVPGGIGTQNIVGARQVNSNGTLGPLVPNPYYQPSR